MVWLNGYRNSQWTFKRVHLWKIPYRVKGPPTLGEREALIIGLIWLVTTIGFEFLFGHYVAKHSWEHLLSDYNILRGRLWLLVLLWSISAPYVFFKLNTRLKL